jgi:type VI secretion system Hcp family effector
MALNSYARLTLNGAALSGDTTQNTVGGVDVSADHIEVHEVRWGSTMPTIVGSGRTGTFRLEPIRITKRIDKATPRLYAALGGNMSVAGDIKLFDTNPEDGTTRHRFTLTITKGRIQSIASWSPDVYDPAMSAQPPREVVELTAPTVRYRDEVSGVEHEQNLIAR